MWQRSQELLAALPELLKSLMQTRQQDEIQSLVARLHDEDVAEALMNLSDEEICQFLEQLDDEAASEIVICIDSDYWSDIFTHMQQDRLIKILRHMPKDEAADLIAELDAEVATEILQSQHSESFFQHVTTLLKYPEDTAGGIMNPEVVFIADSMNSDQALHFIRRNIQLLQNLHYIYLTDSNHHLSGVISLTKLIASSPQALLRDLMNTNVIAVDVLMDQRDVAKIATKYDLTTIPVVDAHNFLMGIITIDDIIDVIEEENEEDVLKMAALSHQEHQTSAFRSAMARVPWLLICLGGSMMAGTIIHVFQGTLEKVIVLTSFMPSIMGMAGNSGIQTSTLIVRNLVSGTPVRNELWEMVIRECRIALLIGLICGSLAGLVAQLFFAKGLLGIVVGVSLFSSILFSTFLGIFWPFFLVKMSVDPAIASGPLITTMNDSTALIIYLSIATMMLTYLH